MSEVIPTLNHFGFQSSLQSPLVQYWISSFNGKNALLDIGCAYGINAFKALEQSIPTIALDPCEDHLEILKADCKPEYKHLLQCVVDSLPMLHQIKDESVSGILCSDVLHFLKGETIEESFRKMYQKLVPGGLLALSMLSDQYLGRIDKGRQETLYERLSVGDKWPGEIKVDYDFSQKFENVIESKRIQRLHIKAVPEIFHFCSEGQLRLELQSKGFTITYSSLGEHPGHPDPTGIGQWEGRSLFMIARKI